MSTVGISCFLVVEAIVNERGYCDRRPAIRVAKNKPALNKNEIAISLNLELPVGLFRRPQITATVRVADDNAPISIEADVQDNIAQAIREANGLDVRLHVGAPEVQP